MSSDVPSTKSHSQPSTSSSDAAELRYSKLFNLIREGFAHYRAVYDDSGKLVDLVVVEINAAGAGLSGVAREDQVGKSWREVWPGVDESLFAIYQRADETGEPIHLENANALTGRTYDVSISRVGPGEFAVTFFDITERKQAEAGFRRAAELIELGDACLELDRDWRVVRVNANQERLSQKPRSETFGRVFWEIWPETADPDSAYWREYHRCMEDRVPVQFDAYYAPLDLWTSVTAYPTTTGIAVFFRNANERKQTEQQLRESEERYRQLFNSMLEGFLVAEVITDASGAPVDYRFIDVNAAMERMTRLRREDLVGRRVSEAVPGIDQHWIELFGRVGLRREPIHFEQYSTRLHRWFGGYAYSPQPRQFATTFVDITERKQTEEALRDSTERLALAIEATELGAFDYRPDDGTLIWSEFTKRHFGLPPTAEVTYDTFLQGLHPDDRDRVEEAVERVLSPESSGEYHVQYRTVGIEDGKERWLDARGRVYFDSDRRPLRMVGTTRDITARQQAQEELSRIQRLSERERELLQAVVGNIPVMLCIYDPALRSFTINRELERVLGWTTEDVNEGDFMAKVYPDPAYREEVATFMRSLSPGWREFAVTAKNGSVVPSEWANIQLSDDRMVGIGIDVRERKRSEEALRLNLEQLRATFDGMVEPVLLADRDANVIAMNAAYLELFEYEAPPRTRDELVGDFVFTMPDGSPLRREESPFSRASRGEVVRDLELRGLNKRTGKTFHILTGAAPVTDQSGDIAAVIITSHDITRRKRAEEALERSNHALRQFAYAAAHDLQEPLRNVAISSELLERRYTGKFDADADRLLATNVEGARRMHRMVKDLLEYTKVIDGIDANPPLLNASAVLDQALANLEDAITETSARVIRQPLPQVRMHETHLLQLFQNLVANSLKYRKQSETPVIRVRAELRGSEWIFAIEDNGIGFDPVHSSRIFGLFKRLHSRDKYPGTGIGLAICTRIVEHYNGRLWADAAPDEGARFYFSVRADGTEEREPV